MSNIHNVPQVTDDERVNIRRAAIEQRATWAAMFYLEAKEEGIDLEPIMRRAIRKVGLMGGEKELAALGGTVTAGAYAKYFATRSMHETFEKDLISDGEDEARVNLCYCPLVKAWQKLGLDDETCALLCDIAMEGDRGIAEALGLDFELGKTLAQGGKACELCYRTRK